MIKLFTTMSILAFVLLIVVSLTSCKSTSKALEQVVETVQYSTDITLELAEGALCDPLLVLAADRRYGESKKMDAYLTLCQVEN